MLLPVVGMLVGAGFGGFFVKIGIVLDLLSAIFTYEYFPQYQS